MLVLHVPPPRCPLPQARDSWVTLDVGCGTGACGPLFRNVSHTLMGVDLSRKMLALADARKAYDDLYVAPVEESLRKLVVKHTVDLVLAADVFPYFGELGAVFEAAAVALRGGGLFGFTTELLPDGGATQPAAVEEPARDGIAQRRPPLFESSVASVAR